MAAVSSNNQPVKFGIAIKLTILLSLFGILASASTGYFTFNATRDILSDKATQGMIDATKLLGRRFYSMANEAANQTRVLANTKLVDDSFGHDNASVIARESLSDNFKSLLSVYPEYFQVRLIGAQEYGREMVRVDRDDGQLVVIPQPHLQEKQHYPYVYKTLKLNKGEVFFSKIFINHERGAHAGLGQPTLQVASPVIDDKGKAIGVIVINVDLNLMFSILKSDMSEEYQLYLTNETGDFLIHPNRLETFGFDRGRQFLVQETFEPVDQIINSGVQAVTIRQTLGFDNIESIGGFTSIPFSQSTGNRFVIIGLTVPIDFALSETNILTETGLRVVLGLSFLGILISLIVARIFVRPLKNLVAVVRRFSETNQVTRLSNYKQDELGLLANSIVSMQEGILTHLTSLNDQNTQLNHEIHEREKIEAYDKFHTHTLELLAQNKNLDDILESIVLGIEGLKEKFICSILLIDKSGKKFIKVIAPNLPDFYNEALEGVEIGIGVGSCGTAAFTKELVIVEDIQTHPFWSNYKTLATQANLASCWSQPIISSSGLTLGTFAMYCREVATPSADDIELIKRTARLTSVSIERKYAEDEVNNLAFFDSLTLLPNRRLLLDRLNQELAARVHSKKQAALLFIDLDKFKALNDSLGHDMGDLLLQQVASRIKACVRESDTVSRLGGDEFVVMLKGLSEQAIVAVSEAEVVGKKILHSLSETYQLASHQYLITPSIGVTLLSADHQNADEVFKQADIAMYQSKKSGGCALFFYDPDMQAHLISRIRIETELREAISKGKQFELYYQPQINSLGIVTGAEALIRWNTADRGIVSPLEFIAIAEESGLILPLGDWVLETACQQLATWALEPKSAHLTLAVNISARQMGIPAFVENVLTIVSQANINPEKLKLELTESILLENMEDTITKMTALKARGIKFSIDDFGTGYSSLQYLKRLPLDQLKIDQSFIQDIENDPNDRAIVRTIIAMANSLNLEVIAEGVETEKQKELLTNKGCLNYQGYLFSKPLPLKMFNQYLTKH